MSSTKRKIPTLIEYADKCKPFKLSKAQKEIIKMMEKYPDRRLTLRPRGLIGR